MTATLTAPAPAPALPDFAGLVAKGVQLLDQRRPGWQFEVNPTDLDMGNPDADLVGTIWGECYGTGWRALGIEYYQPVPEGPRYPHEYGLDLHWGDPVGWYPLLTAEWVRAITSRRQHVSLRALLRLHAYACEPDPWPIQRPARLGYLLDALTVASLVVRYHFHQMTGGAR